MSPASPTAVQAGRPWGTGCCAEDPHHRPGLVRARHLLLSPVQGRLLPSASVSPSRSGHQAHPRCWHVLHVGRLLYSGQQLRAQPLRPPPKGIWTVDSTATFSSISGHRGGS